MSTVQVVSPMNCLFYPQKGVSNLDMMMNPTNAGGSNCDKYYSNNNDSNSSRDDVNDQAHPFLRFNSTEAFASQQSIQEDAKKPSFRSLSPLTSSSKGMPLPAGFVPGPMDVICHRGKGAFNHPGNKRYRQIIEDAVPKYSKLKSRIQKSMIVADIVHKIQSESPNGGFVKPHGKNGWIQVAEDLAHGKVGQSFRDLLQDKYKSSTAAKKRRRKEVNEKFGDDFDAIIQSNKDISKKLTTVSNKLQLMGPGASEDSVSNLFDTANSDLLEFLKRNSTSTTHSTSSTTKRKASVKTDVATFADAAVSGQHEDDTTSSSEDL